MSNICPKKTRLAGAMSAVALSLLLSACATTRTMQPFSTDGCSMFPDRSLLSKTDWCSCCVAHDLAYWRGGTAEERLQADLALRDCVLAASRSRTLADLMYAGVRTGGGPYYLTPYRWGYGWRFGRLYQPLTAAEAEQASSMRAGYLAGNPALVCPKESP
ncbi:MAG TPA: hypothetical protein VIU93_13915 [Gallionellaceae bacterium]